MNRREDIMQQGRAVTITAALRHGEAQFHDHQTPLSALLASEERGDEVDRGAALSGVMAYLFSRSPHPAHVMQRLYVLTAETEPALLRTVPPGELRLLTRAGEEAHLARVELLLRGTRLDRCPGWRHDRVIGRTLMQAYQRQRAPGVLAACELAEVLANLPDESLKAYELRMRLLGGVLGYFFADGPAPELTVVRVFALAKAKYPELIHELSVRQMGVIFGVEGATWSQRIKQKVNRFLAERGATAVMARFQKSPEACAAYARAQQGNHNRRGGEARERSA